MGYSDDEIQASVEQLVRSSIRRPVDSLGVRKVGTTFSDIQESSASIFLLYQTSPFYVVWLGTQRLLEVVTDLTSQLNQLIDAVRASGRVVLPINDVTSLANARAAIFDLESSVGQRTVSFKQISTTPSYQRFNANIDRFLAANGGNIKQDGDIVSTPQEAKTVIRSLTADVKETLAELQRRVGLLANALTDYSSLNLPMLVSGGVLKRTRNMVSSLTAEMTKLDPTARLRLLRSSVLDLIAAKSVVSQLGTFKQPDPFFLVEGTGGAYSDSSHLTTAAVLVSELPAPYEIPTMEELVLTVDGSPSSVYLNGSNYAELSGTVSEPFVFTDLGRAQLLGTNNEPFSNLVVGRRFVFRVRNTTTGLDVPIDVAVPMGIGFSLATVLVSINAAIASAGMDGQYYAGDGGTGNVGLFSVGNGSAYRITIGDSAGNALYGFTKDATVAGPEDNKQLRIDVNGAVYTMTFTAGSKTALQVASAVIAAFPGVFTASPPAFTPPPSPPGTIPYVTIRYIGPGTFERSIMFPGASNPAAPLLGLVTDIAVNARKTSGKDVAANLNALSARIKASYQTITPARAGALLARTEPSNNTRLVVYFVANTATAAVDGATAIDLWGPAFETLGVQVGDVAVITDGVNAGTKWTVDLVEATHIHATGTTTAIAGACFVEVGPDLGVTKGWVVDITERVTNKGVYTIEATAGIQVDEFTFLPVPFYFDLQEPLPAYKDQGALPYYMTNVKVGRQHLVVASTGRTTATAIAMSGDAALHFFTSGSGSAIGTSPWVQLPQKVVGLDVDDKLEYYATYYAQPSSTYVIVSVEGQIIRVTPEVPTTSSFAFASGSPPPFALLRSAAYERFAAMAEALTTWLSLDQNKSSFMRELERRLNIVLVEASPTASQVGDAVNQVTSLKQVVAVEGALMPEVTVERVLRTYRVARVEPIDNLLRTFIEKGGRRAVDILLEARFLDFFGLDSHDVSYSGAMLSKMREIAREDLPVSKIDRKESRKSKVISSSTSPDFEYDHSDLDKSPIPDIPAGFFQPGYKRIT